MLRINSNWPGCNATSWLETGRGTINKGWWQPAPHWAGRRRHRVSAERRAWVSLSLFNILISNLAVNSVFMKFTKILNWEEVAIPVQEHKKSTERFGKTRGNVQNRRIMFGNTQQIQLGVGGVLYTGDSLNTFKSNSVSERMITMVLYTILCRYKQILSCLFGGRKFVLSGVGNSAPSREQQESNRTSRHKGLMQSQIKGGKWAWLNGMLKVWDCLKGLNSSCREGWSAVVQGI